MPPALNRTAIVLDLAALVSVSVFCVSTQAPLIQQDILKRCQDALLVRHISMKGVAVEGRDVVLSDTGESEIASVRARLALEQVPGVRSVKTIIVADTTGARGGEAGGGRARELDGEVNGVLEPATEAQEKDTQGKIDRVLDTEAIRFKGETAVLTTESGAVLDKIVAYLAEAPNLICEIRGYDSHPRAMRQNWVLALQRSLATEDYLIGKGVAAWRLSTHAFQIGDGTAGRRTDRIIDLVVRAR